MRLKVGDDERGIVDEFARSSREGIWAAEDMASNEGTVIHAMGNAKKSALDPPLSIKVADDELPQVLNHHVDPLWVLALYIIISTNSEPSKGILPSVGLIYCEYIGALNP